MVDHARSVFLGSDDDRLHTAMIGTIPFDIDIIQALLNILNVFVGKTMMIAIVENIKQTIMSLHIIMQYRRIGNTCHYEHLCGVIDLGRQACFEIDQFAIAI